MRPFSTQINSALATQDMNMKHTLLLLVIIFLSNPLSASGTRKDEESPIAPLHPIWPTILGATIITKWVYDMGDSTEKSQKNIIYLWGGAMLASLGIVIYQKSVEKENNIRLSLVPHYNSSHIVLRYNF